VSPRPSDGYPDPPLYPSATLDRARCRELIQHLELNCEWVARRLYRECFFGGTVSAETKADVRERLDNGLAAVSRLSSFSPYILGLTLTAADCVAFVHFTMISLATVAIYGEDLVQQHVPKSVAYMDVMRARPAVVAISAGRISAMQAFIALNVKYDG
jgi:glutathione S-transferase